MDNWTMTTQGLSPLAEISSRLLAGMVTNPDILRANNQEYAAIAKHAIRQAKALIAELEKEND